MQTSLPTPAQRSGAPALIPAGCRALLREHGELLPLLPASSAEGPVSRSPAVSAPCRNAAEIPGPLLTAVQQWDSFLFLCGRGRKLLSVRLISRRWLFLYRDQHVLYAQGDPRIKNTGYCLHCRGCEQIQMRKMFPFLNYLHNPI